MVSSVLKAINFGREHADKKNVSAQYSLKDNFPDNPMNLLINLILNDTSTALIKNYQHSPWFQSQFYKPFPIL